MYSGSRGVPTTSSGQTGAVWMQPAMTGLVNGQYATAMSPYDNGQVASPMQLYPAAIAAGHASKRHVPNHLYPVGSQPNSRSQTAVHGTSHKNSPTASPFSPYAYPNQHHQVERQQMPQLSPQYSVNSLQMGSPRAVPAGFPAGYTQIREPSATSQFARRAVTTGVQGQHSSPHGQPW